MNDTTLTTRTTEIVLPGRVESSGLQVHARDLPAPAAGEAVLRMDATGVSFAEQQMRLGKYYNQPPFPFVPGYDVVGTVTATGPDVDPAMIGRRFAAVTKTGSWASHQLIDVADLVPVPDEQYVVLATNRFSGGRVLLSPFASTNSRAHP